MTLLNENRFDDKRLTTGQAASELNIAPGTLQNWRTQGVGPRFVKHRRRVFYYLKDLIDYKNEHFKVYSSTSEWKEECL